MGFTIEISKFAPQFSLPGVDGKTYALKDFTAAKAVVVCFTCNHCPAATGNESRERAFVNEYAPKGVAYIAINSNDLAFHPDDSFEHMKERAKRLGFTWPFLRDESQMVAKAYGAQRTPHFFVLDAARKVVYTGRMDDNPHDGTQATTHELRDAVDALLAGKPIRMPVTEPIGCNVKWRGKDAHWMPNSLVDFR
ncbi:MAG: thioredoxin family protein [Planctomycetota bacterium]|nr:thioredoxin family protein [Planctomycetota bacterium]